MLIEYYATDYEDIQIDRVLKPYAITNWFNPEENYYVLETEDDRVITALALLGIELYITNKDPENTENDK